MKLLTSALVFSLSSVCVFACLTCLDCGPKPCPNTYETIQLPCGCPEFSYVSNFNLTLLQGVWYQHYGSLTGTQAGCDGNCINVYVARQNDNNFTINFCCNKGGDKFCGEALGSGILGYPDVSDPRKILFWTNGLIIETYFLDVDYSNYLIVYKCFQLNGQRNEFVEIFTRSPEISDCVAESTLATLRSVTLNPDIIQEIPQSSRCPYNF